MRERVSVLDRVAPHVPHDVASTMLWIEFAFQRALTKVIAEA